MDSGSETSEDEMSIHVDETVPVGDLSLPFPPRDVKVRRDAEVRQMYTLGEEVGRGKFGIVYRCADPSTGLQLAVKFVATPRRDDKRDVEREVDIMNYLQHPGIIQIYDAFDGGKEMALVMELVEGGELFDRVIEDDYILTEKACAIFIRQVCAGVNFMHSKNVLHLDMKPENILCLSKTGNRIKIIDFGLARRFDPTKKLQVLFGTPEFVAPEVVNFDAIGYATDMWSVGVIAYVLVSGLSPFMGDTDCETMANVTIAKYDFDDEAFDDVSDACKEFIAAILIKDKSKRLTSDQALQHRWLNMTSSPVPSRVARSRTASIEVSDLSLGAAQLNMGQFVERWMAHPDSPYAFSNSSAELVLSRVGSQNSVGLCSRSLCESVSSPAESSAESSDGEDEEAKCRALMLPPGVGPEKPKPAEHIRVSSIRREDSLKRARGRLVHQASKEEHYISIDEVKTLKQQGSLDDMVMKVASRPDSRRGSVTQSPAAARLRTTEPGSLRRTPSPLVSTTPSGADLPRSRSPAAQSGTVCDRVMQEAAAALATAVTSVSPAAGSGRQTVSQSTAGGRPSTSPSGATPTGAGLARATSPAAFGVALKPVSTSKGSSPDGRESKLAALAPDTSRLSVTARSRTPSVTVTGAEDTPAPTAAADSPATKGRKSGSVSPVPKTLEKEAAEEKRKAKSPSPGAAPPPALSVDVDEADLTKTRRKRSKSPSVNKASDMDNVTTESLKPPRCKTPSTSEPPAERVSPKTHRSQTPTAPSGSPGPPLSPTPKDRPPGRATEDAAAPPRSRIIHHTVVPEPASPTAAVGSAARVIHHTVVPESPSPTPSSPVPAPETKAKKSAEQANKAAELGSGSISSMIKGLKPVKKMVPAPAAQVSLKSTGLVLPQLRRVSASKSDNSIPTSKTAGEATQVKLKRAKPSAPVLSTKDKPTVKDRSESGSNTLKKKTPKKLPSIDGEAPPANGSDSTTKKRQSKNGRRPRQQVIQIEVLSCAGREQADSGLRRLRRALRTLSTGSSSAPSSPYQSRRASPEPTRRHSPERLIKWWHSARLSADAGDWSGAGPSLLAFISAQLEAAASQHRQQRQLFRDSLLAERQLLLPETLCRPRPPAQLLWARMGCSIPD